MDVFKIIHIIMIISWFAGLFYLPRIFVNMALQEGTEIEKYLIGMAKRLYNFMTILSIGVVASGIGIYLSKCIMNNDIETDKHIWMYLKLMTVTILFLYQNMCGRIIQVFDNKQNNKSHKFYRIFNEIPLILLTIIISLVTLKPF